MYLDYTRTIVTDNGLIYLPRLPVHGGHLSFKNLEKLQNYQTLVNGLSVL